MRPEQARPRTNIQVTFGSRKAPVLAFDALRGWMGSLAMVRAKLMGSTAPKRGSDPIKPDHKPTYRSCFLTILA